MYVQFLVRIDMEVPDSKDINDLYFGDVGSIIAQGINNQVIEYTTESVINLESEE